MKTKPAPAISAIGGDSGIPAALSNLIGYHLRIAQEASFQAIRLGAGRSNLKPGWYTILTILSENPGLTPTGLSKLCGRDRSTLTSTLKGLSARGFIASRRNSGDQRSYSVRLTAAGEAMLKKLQVIAKAHDARLDAIVGKDKPLLMTLLRRIVEGLGQADTPLQRGNAVGTGPRPRLKHPRLKQGRTSAAA